MKTKKTIFSLCLLLLMNYAFVSFAAAETDIPALVKKISCSVVIINTYDYAGGVVAQGSGFFINAEGDVITNMHVIDGAQYATVKTSNGRTYKVNKILVEDTDADLVRLSVEIPQQVVKPISISRSLPEAGERILVIGNPLGFEQTVSDGIVSAVRYVPSFGNIVQITAPVSSGSSGSPVVNMKGEVIGVATFIMLQGQNLNFAIPGEKIKRLAEERKETITAWNNESKDSYNDTSKNYNSKSTAYKPSGTTYNSPSNASAFYEDYKRKEYGESSYNQGVDYGRNRKSWQALEDYRKSRGFDSAMYVFKRFWTGRR